MPLPNTFGIIKLFWARLKAITVIWERKLGNKRCRMGFISQEHPIIKRVSLN